MNIGSLFSGIGGLELGLERAGLGTVIWNAEIDPFCRSVLHKHWPKAKQYTDVKQVDQSTERVDVLCGGFPCQDVSVIGKREGLDGERSGLWFEFRRITEELEPKIVVIENVFGLRSSGLRTVLSDLASLGFDAEWADLSAASTGAPHERRRLFIVATHPHRTTLRDEPGWLFRACREVSAKHRCVNPPSCESTEDGYKRLEQARDFAVQRGWLESVRWELHHPAGMDDGFPPWVDVASARKALGNAVVPACAEVIGNAIKKAVTIP